MVEHLEAILVSGGVFREKCTACHRRAVGLARTWLVLKDGKVTGRYTGRDIGAFLENHGRLTEDEIPKVLAMLERQLTASED